jgi:signal transduction histidine kinase
LALQHTTDGDLPKVLADRHRMLQVLSNLVANAVKFTRRGSVTVEAKRVRETVRLAVSDTGAGIDPKELPHLFERFWRGERDASGIGLGLAIARGIVNAHKSELRVISDAGRGTRFEFELCVAG